MEQKVKNGGIRLYQNKDGSLTALGKLRARQLRDKYEKKTSKIKSKYEEITGKKMNETENKKPKTYKDMTNKELSEATTRLVLENNYLTALSNSKKLNPKQVSLGMKFIKKVGKDVIVPPLMSVGKDWLEKELRKATGTQKQQNKKKKK